MIKVGIRLALRGGRSGLGRLLLIATALAAGAATLIIASWAITAALARYDRVNARIGGAFAPLGMLVHREQGVPLATVAEGKPFVLWSNSTLAAPHVRTITAVSVATS